MKLEHYRRLLQHDMNRKSGLRAVPKLSNKHIEPNNYQKMSVSLAAQVRLTGDFTCNQSMLNKNASLGLGAPLLRPSWRSWLDLQRVQQT